MAVPVAGNKSHPCCGGKRPAAIILSPGGTNHRQGSRNFERILCEPDAQHYEPSWTAMARVAPPVVFSLAVLAAAVCATPAFAQGFAIRTFFNSPAPSTPPPPPPPPPSA